MPVFHLLDADHEVKPVADVMVWAKWFETADRVVGRTSIGPVEVSTVFLGMTHGTDAEGRPLLFETMVFFDGDVPGRAFSDGDCERSCTWIEADQTHARWCDTVRKEK